MILAVLEARAACPKLAAALLSPILGEPMIWRQIERVRRARSVSKIEVLVGDRACDDKLAGFLLSRGVDVRRDGQADDPGHWSASHVALIPADRPLIDPRLIDRTVELALRTGCAAAHAGQQIEIVSATAFASGQRKPEARLGGEHPDWRVQTAEDFARVRDVYKALYSEDPEFGAEEVLDYLQTQGQRRAA